MPSGSRNSRALVRMLHHATGCRKFTAVKPEVLKSQLLDKIDTPFQRLYTDVFRVTKLKGTITDAAQCKPEVGNPRWRPLKRK